MKLKCPEEGAQSIAEFVPPPEIRTGFYKVSIAQYHQPVFAGGGGQRSTGGRTTAARDLAKVTLMMPRSVESLEDGPLYAALAMGYWEEEGLDVSIVDGGVDDCRMLETGQANFATPAPAITIPAIANDMKVKSFFQYDNINIFGFAVHESSPIRTWADIKGKSIALGMADWQGLAEPILLAAGIDPKKDVTWIVAGESRTAMVENKNIDILFTWVSEVYQYNGQGLHLRYIDGDEVFKNCGNSFITSLDMIQNHPGWVKGFARGLAKGRKAPDSFEPTQYNTLKKKLERYGKEKWMVGSITCTLFETAWALRGMETFLMDMVEDEDYTNELFDKVMYQPLHTGLMGVKLGVDMLWTGDDVAIQGGMLMSPELFRKYLKPRFAHMISEFRKVNPDIKIAYHTCGNPSLVLDDIIEMGVDIYHSIQPRAIDPLEVKKRYGKRLSLWGGLDVQHILPFAKPEEVKAEVKRLVEGCGKDGGYIIGPAHHIQMDTPLENVLAFYNAAKEYGPYKK